MFFCLQLFSVFDSLLVEAERHGSNASILWRRTANCELPSPVPSPSLRVNPSPPMSHGGNAAPWRPERSASNIKSCTATARVRMVSRRSFRNKLKSSERYLTGASLRMIKGELEQQGVKCSEDSPEWTISRIRSILQNEKYCGDVLMQKTFRQDFINHKAIKNTGQLPMYSSMPELLDEALHLNWTQNVVIMEAELPTEERCWYIRQAAAQSLSKSELLRMIEDSEHLESVLDEKVDVWYNVDNDEISERTQYEENSVYLPWQYLPQPDGRVCNEGLGKEGWAGITVSYRIGGHQPGGDRQPGLSSGTAQAGRAWDHLQQSHGTAAHQSGLRRIRPVDRHGQCQPAGYVPHLRRRLCRQDVPPDGPYYPPRQCGRPVAHRGLRVNLAGCAGGLPGVAERIHDRMR